AEAPPLVGDGVGQRRPVSQVSGAAEVVADDLDVDPGGPYDLQGLADLLGADAVPADHCDLVAHVMSLRRLVPGPWSGAVARAPPREMTNRPPRWTVGSGRPGSRRALQDDDYRGAQVAHRTASVLLHGIARQLRRARRRPKAAPSDDVVVARATASVLIHAPDPPPLSGRVRAASGRVRRSDDARPGRDRTQDRGRPRA